MVRGPPCGGRLLLGTVTLLLALAACSNSHRTAASLDEAVREKPGVPLVLPQSVPA